MTTSKAQSDSRSDAKSAARSNLQFAYDDPLLPTRLAEDIRRSSYTSRPKYLNALLQKVLSFKPVASTSSCIGELFELIELFESLPIERIRRLAPAQNRNFGQMVKHLLEIALIHYPEDSQLPVSTQDVHLAEAVTHQLRLSHYRARPDVNIRPSAVRAEEGQASFL